jgi:ElaB/YqjD/DUF883 family membrane-anchored ribosome-binding protein
MFSTATKDEAIKLKNASQNTAHEVSNDLHDVANQAGRKVRSMYNAASDEISQASDKVTTEIRSNPVRSSMIALGVGVLLGALLRR